MVLPGRWWSGEVVVVAVGSIVAVVLAGRLSSLGGCNARCHSECSTAVAAVVAVVAGPFLRTTRSVRRGELD